MTTVYPTHGDSATPVTTSRLTKGRIARHVVAACVLAGLLSGTVAGASRRRVVAPGLAAAVTPLQVDAYLNHNVVLIARAIPKLHASRNPRIYSSTFTETGTIGLNAYDVSVTPHAGPHYELSIAAFVNANGKPDLSRIRLITLGNASSEVWFAGILPTKGWTFVGSYVNRSQTVVTRVEAATHPLSREQALTWTKARAAVTQANDILGDAENYAPSHSLTPAFPFQPGERNPAVPPV